MGPFYLFTSKVFVRGNKPAFRRGGYPQNGVSARRWAVQKGRG